MKQTPMLQQYLELKALHDDALLLYRLGDFYELFFEDAERAAPVLGIVLTHRRHNDAVESPMCGIPHHAMTSYVGKLLDAGFKVAVAEQLEDPAAAKGIVRRGIVRVLTPGGGSPPARCGARPHAGGSSPWRPTADEWRRRISRRPPERWAGACVPMPARSASSWPSSGRARCCCPTAVGLPPTRGTPTSTPPS
jgi:hypothetical protein